MSTRQRLNLLSLHMEGFGPGFNMEVSVFCFGCQAIAATAYLLYLLVISQRHHVAWRDERALDGFLRVKNWSEFPT